ncbi:MAG: cell division protein FtsA [Candidatus Promineifilaceae bacterium]
MEEIIFGLDIGTTKVCALVGAVRGGQMQIIGMGTAPSRGMRKGMIIDVQEATAAIAQAVEKAEETSGFQLSHGLVSMAGEHISATNSSGVVAIGKNENGVTKQDIEQALDMAQNIPLPYNRQIVHVVPRRYTIDDQDVRRPIGMHGFKLEVETHIVTGDKPSLQNLAKCTADVGINPELFVLNALASGEAVLEPSEREMGVIVADIGGGTTDIALYKDGTVWHTKVIPVGGYHITNDIAIGLRAPYEVAEEVKIQYGDCRPDQINPEYVFTVEPFGGEKIQVGRQDLAYVIEARVEELFQLVLKEISLSGYNGMLPAGIVLTGGSANLRGMTDVAERVLRVPARVARPKNMLGLVETLQSPAYATSVGLLRWMQNENNHYQPRSRHGEWSRRFNNFVKALLPG